MMTPPAAETTSKKTEATAQKQEAKGAEKKEAKSAADQFPNTKQGILEEVRSLERSIARWGGQLSHTALLQTRIIDCVSRLLLHRDGQFDSSRLVASYVWLGNMFVDLHRGVRETVREGMVRVAESRCTPYDSSKGFADSTTTEGKFTENTSSMSSMHGEKRGESFLQHVQKSIFGLFKALKDPSSLSADSANNTPEWFHRRRPRSDLIYLLGHLIPYSNNGKMRLDVVELFIQLWDDTDSVIRAVAIDMIQLLIRTHYPEIASYVKHKDANKSSPLMKAILQRVRDPEYGSAAHQHMRRQRSASGRAECGSIGRIRVAALSLILFLFHVCVSRRAVTRRS
jgi:hypothetical protein